MAPTLEPTASTALKAGYLVVAGIDAVMAGSASSKVRKSRVFTKPLLMPLLASSLLTDRSAAASPLTRTTLAGQAGGWCGDMVLLKEGPESFMVGAASFAAGHTAYISGFRAQRATTSQPGPKAIAALWALTAPRLAFGAAKKDRRLGATTVVYSAILSSMFAATTQLSTTMPTSARRATMLGGALFLVSDGLIGAGEFLLEDPPPRLETAVMLTYASAQFLLAEGASRAGVA
jgi:uncharacterized membrane protein YhhN